MLCLGVYALIFLLCFAQGPTKLFNLEHKDTY